MSGRLIHWSNDRVMISSSVHDAGRPGVISTGVNFRSWAA